MSQSASTCFGELGVLEYVVMGFLLCCTLGDDCMVVDSGPPDRVLIILGWSAVSGCTLHSCAACDSETDALTRSISVDET